MGLFRRKDKDPFASGRDREAGARSDDAWLADLPESEIEIDVNKNALFTDADRAWLERDPGEEIRRRKR